MKNQARWVARFLADMAALHARTGDSHFSVVLVDFESQDMDVARALRTAGLPRYRPRTHPILPPRGFLPGRCPRNHTYPHPPGTST